MRVKARYAAPLLLAGCLSVLVEAPIAEAQPNCVDVGGATRCGSPGNVQIDASPRQSGPYLPYGCDPAYAALCYDNIPGVAIHVGPRPNPPHPHPHPHPRPHR